MKLSWTIFLWTLLIYQAGQPSQEKAIDALKKMNADITITEGKSGSEIAIGFAGSAITNEKMKNLEQLPQVCSIDL